MMKNTASVWTHLIVIAVGIIFVSERLWVVAQYSIIETLATGLFSSYVALSVFYGFRLLADRIQGILDFVILWFVPFALLFTFFFAMGYGFVVSIPKFIYSIFLWKKEKRYKNFKNQYISSSQQQQQSIKSNFIRQADHNVIRFPKR